MNEISNDMDYKEKNFKIRDFFAKKKFKMPWTDKELMIAKNFCLQIFLI